MQKKYKETTLYGKRAKRREVFVRMELPFKKW